MLVEVKIPRIKWTKKRTIIQWIEWAIRKLHCLYNRTLGKKEYQRKYYLIHKERLQEIKREYYKKNRDVFLLRAKERSFNKFLKNKDCI